MRIIRNKFSCPRIMYGLVFIVFTYGGIFFHIFWILFTDFTFTLISNLIFYIGNLFVVNPLLLFLYYLAHL